MGGGNATGDGMCSGAEVRTEITGTVTGPAVQARAIHVDVRITMTAPPYTPAPAQLAPSPAVFIGRDRELADLHRLLDEDGAPHGPP